MSEAVDLQPVAALRLRLATFSIAARDPATGMLGVAVSSKALAAGALCPFVRSGVGAVASQAYVNPFLGPVILDYLDKGLTRANCPDRRAAASAAVRTEAAAGGSTWRCAAWSASSVPDCDRSVRPCSYHPS